jgi:hypothetical protein
MALPNYFVLDTSNPNRMLLYDMPNPSARETWVGGVRFRSRIDEPVIVEIQPGYEKAELVPYFDRANLMSDAFYEALREAGVDNLDVYEAEIHSGDGRIVHRGYRAFNVIGVVEAADLDKTVFNSPPGTTLIDASIETLEIDARRTGGLLLFRLAEYVSAVVVHEKIKNAIEAKGFRDVIFREPSEFMS